MYKFGPYGPNHATAGTFAFKRALLKQTRYQDDAVIGEEKFFLKDYTIPFVQLDPLKTILVFSHSQNTFDKKKLIDTKNSVCKESSLKVKHFIKSKELHSFYTKELDPLLESYELGQLKYKPDVIAEINRRDQLRECRPITTQELITALSRKTEELIELQKELDQKNEYIKLLVENIRSRDSSRSS
jgi:hypothetical protein